MKKAIQFTFIDKDKEKLIRLDLMLKSKLEENGNYDLHEEGIREMHFPDNTNQYRKTYIVQVKSNHKSTYNEAYELINSVKPVYYRKINRFFTFG